MGAPDDMVQGLADRTRNLLRVLDRQDRLETAGTFVGWLEGEVRDGRLVESTRELLLRALAVAGDPVSFRLLERLDPLEGVELPALMRDTGLGRVAASERVHDLVQVGLASRDLVSDQVRGTALAAGIVALVAAVAGETADRLREELGAAAPGRRRPDA